MSRLSRASAVERERKRNSNGQLPFPHTILILSSGENCLLGLLSPIALLPEWENGNLCGSLLVLANTLVILSFLIKLLYGEDVRKLPRGMEGACCSGLRAGF